MIIRYNARLINGKSKQLFRNCLHFACLHICKIFNLLTVSRDQPIMLRNGGKNRDILNISTLSRSRGLTPPCLHRLFVYFKPWRKFNLWITRNARERGVGGWVALISSHSWILGISYESWLVQLFFCILYVFNLYKEWGQETEKILPSPLSFLSMSTDPCFS